MPFIKASLAVEKGFRISLSLLCFPLLHRKLPLKEENGKESLKPDTIEIKVHSDNSIHMKPDDSRA